MKGSFVELLVFGEAVDGDEGGSIVVVVAVAGVAGGIFPFIFQSQVMTSNNGCNVTTTRTSILLEREMSCMNGEWFSITTQCEHRIDISQSVSCS